MKKPQISTANSAKIQQYYTRWKLFIPKSLMAFNRNRNNYVFRMITNDSITAADIDIPMIMWN
jgi:hypothetical protein